ncbi:MAG: 4-(cytidine 5'-diphospho)-2-C-methyl-D-erythritol kinase [bacterium]|nr:4-(cytidine 5'-diphospho)-2-C-methyl-D-erythritol kinase [bacterium]
MLLNAYAKVNLFLEVVARRDDGYHDVVTILQTISLDDDIELSGHENDITLTCVPQNLPADDRNLAYRAARLLKEKTGTKQGVAIRLNKHIPTGAGLGGGSSDAAAIFLGCNQFWNCNLAYSDIAEIAMQVGMDVPFFLRGGTALALGRGERIVQQLPTPELNLVIVYPSFPVPTASIYKNLDIHAVVKKKEPTSLLSAIETRDIKGIAESLYNRLETTAFKLHPELAEIKEELVNAGCLGALLSGSGSAVFGITQTKEAAYLIAQKLSSETNFWVQSVSTIPQIS